MLSQAGAVRSAAASLAAAAGGCHCRQGEDREPVKGIYGSRRVLGNWLGKWYSVEGEGCKSSSAGSDQHSDIVSGTGYWHEYPGVAASRNLDDNYNYTRTARYTIIVPVEIDGKETARVTAPYTEAELEKLQKRNNRRKGIR